MNKILLLSLSVVLILILIFFFKSSPKENFEQSKDTDIKFFDKQVIELDKLREDNANIDNFKPIKESDLKLFCKQNKNEEPTCYRQ